MTTSVSATITTAYAPVQLTEARTQAIADFTSMVAKLDTASAAHEPFEVRAWVVRSSEGLYLMHIANGEYAPRGILLAHRYPERQARQLATRVVNGFGDQCEPVRYAEALDTERASLLGLIAALQAAKS